MLHAIVWLVGLLVLIVVLVVLGLVLFSAYIARKVEANCPPVGRFVDIDGSRIHYIDEGSGPSVVFVHGLAGQMQHMTYNLVDRLKGDFRVIALDRPGCGYSERAPGASARLPIQAATVAAFIRALGLDRPLLVGHSLGGAVSLATALDHGDRVGGLALIAPLTHMQSDPPEALKGLAVASPMMRRIIAWTLATPLSMRGGAAILVDIFGPNPVPSDFATRGGALLGLRPKTFYAASSDMVALIDDLPAMVERYGSLDVPVGILYGTEDRILHPQVQGEPMLSKVPGLTLEMIKGQGHMLPITATERTAQFITAVAARMHAPAH